mgnify:CR=1 FL=1
MVKIAGQVVRRIGTTWGIVWGKGFFATVYKWDPRARALRFTTAELSELGGTFTPTDAEFKAASAGF